MSIVGKSNSFMCSAFSQHVFFRHARVPIKQKVTNTICDDQSSYPLIYRRHCPFTLLNDCLSFYKCPSDIVTTFASHSDKCALLESSPKHCKEDRQGIVKEWPI